MTVLLMTAILFAFSIPSAAAQAQIEGHWEGAMVRQNSELPVSFDIVSDATGLHMSFNSPAQRASGIPLRNVTYTAPNLHFLLVGDVASITYDGEVAPDRISGTFKEGRGRGAQFREGDVRGGVFREGE